MLLVAFQLACPELPYLSCVCASVVLGDAVNCKTKLTLLLCYLRDGENNLPSTPFEIYTEFNKKCVCTNEIAARNLCNERLGALC